MPKYITSIIYLFALFFLSLGVTEMSNAETWILDDSPIPENEIEAKIELYSEQKTMGAGSTKKAIEAFVTLGKQHVYAPQSSNQKSSAQMIASDQNKSSYYLVEIPFTINPLVNKRKYEKLTLKINLSTEGATAFRMFPNSVVTKEDAQKHIDLSGEFASKGISLGGNTSYNVRFENIRPLITAFGEGQRNFSWTFERQKGKPLLLGNRRTLILLEVTQDTKIVQGTLDSKGFIEGIFPWSNNQKVDAKSHAIKWDLEKVGSLNDIPWKIDDVKSRSLM